MTENGWERLGKTGRRANKTTRGRDHETSEKPSRSQAFSGVLRRSQVCETVRHCHAPKRDEFLSEGVRCGAIPKDDWMGVYLAYIPIQTNELGAADAPLSRQGLGVRRVPSATLGKNAVDG